jgi:hypothetical protein
MERAGSKAVSAGVLDPSVQGVFWRECLHSGNGFQDLFSESELWGLEGRLVFQCGCRCGSEASRNCSHDVSLDGR